MKRTIICCLLLLSALSMQAQSPFSYTLKGVMSSNGFDGYEFPIMRYDNSQHIGKIKVKGNTFEYHGTADSAMYCRIDAGTDFGNFIVDAGTVEVDMKNHSFPSGTPLNEAYTEFSFLQNKMSAALDSIRKSVINGDMDRETRIKRLNELEYPMELMRKLQRIYLKPFILKHCNDEVGVAACQKYFIYAGPEDLDDIYPYLGEWILSRKQIKEQIAQIEQSKKMAPGKPFIDFEGEDVHGNKVKLSDYVGKGKYVIVDYSASWCGPCIAEIPNLVEVYDMFNGKHFDMVTVMVWDKPENSKKMLKEHDVQWKSIINVGMKPMELYGFAGIPRIMLIAPDGTIVENELRGVMIRQKLKEVLPQK